MRSGNVLAALAALLILGAGSAAFAASACTSWIHLDTGYKDTNLYDARANEQCVRDVQDQTQRAGYRSQVNVDTLFFWFGDDVVTARCLSRTLVVFMAYDFRARDACPLLNQVKNTLRQQY
jgi:hypothetical protein